MPLDNPSSGGTWNTIALSLSYVPRPGFLVPAYRKDSLGIVYLRGTANYVSGPAGTVLTLPAGFRPLGICRFTVSGGGNSALATAWLNMQSNGNLDYAGGSASVVSFDQISFSTY